jgi:GT2 family glycosyltransferase
VSALQVGWEAATGRHVAFCDDDARYPNTWLQQLLKWFRDPRVGATGGVIRQIGYIRKTVSDRNFANVGWLGRTTYNGFEKPTFTEPIDVDFLPGANMIVRRDLLAADDFMTELDAPGSSPGWELSLCLRVKEQGFRVLLDPLVEVEHIGAPWVDGQRGQSNARVHAYSRNITLIMLTYMTWARRVAFLLYFWGVGQMESPGLLVIPWLAFRDPRSLWATVGSAYRGKAEGIVLAIRRLGSDSKRAAT